MSDPTNLNGGVTDPNSDELEEAWTSSNEGADSNDLSFGAADDGTHYGSHGTQANAGDALGAEPSDYVSDVEVIPKKGMPMAMVGVGVVGLAVLGIAGLIVMDFYKKLSPTTQNTQNKMVVLENLQPVAINEADTSSIPGGADLAGVGQLTALPGGAAGASDVLVKQVTEVLTVDGAVAGASSESARQALVKAAKQSTLENPPFAQASEAVICPVEAAPSAEMMAKKVMADKKRKEAREQAARNRARRASLEARKAANKAKRDRQIALSKQAKNTVVVSGAKTELAYVAPPAKTLLKLSEYRLMSIWPKTGEFQQATLKDGAGANYVVRAGDTLGGARIKSVDALTFTVETDAGFIR